MQGMSATTVVQHNHIGDLACLETVLDHHIDTLELKEVTMAAGMETISAGCHGVLDAMLVTRGVLCFLVLERGLFMLFANKALLCLWLILCISSYFQILQHQIGRN